jgi:hypothetical protein
MISGMLPACCTWLKDALLVFLICQQLVRKLSAITEIIPRPRHHHNHNIAKNAHTLDPRDLAAAAATAAVIAAIIVWGPHAQAAKAVATRGAWRQQLVLLVDICLHITQKAAKSDGLKDGPPLCCHCDLHDVDLQYTQNPIGQCRIAWCTPPVSETLPLHRIPDSRVDHLLLLDCLLHTLHDLLKRGNVPADCLLHLLCELLDIAKKCCALRLHKRLPLCAD